MPRSETSDKAVRREREALTSDLGWLELRHRRGEHQAADVLSTTIVERVGRCAGILDLAELTAIGNTLVSCERPLDATAMLEPALGSIAPDDLSGPANWYRRVLLGAAEPAGRLAVAQAVGDSLLRAPWLGPLERSDALLIVAEVDRQEGRFDAAAHRIGEAEWHLNALPPDEHTVARWGWIRARWGVLAHSLGDLAGAYARFGEALGSPGLGGARPLVAALGADVLVDAGDLESAATLLDIADAASPPPTRSTAGLIALVRGRHLVRVGRPDDAKAAFDRAEGDLVGAQRMPLVARVGRERRASSRTGSA